MRTVRPPSETSNSPMPVRLTSWISLRISARSKAAPLPAHPFYRSAGPGVDFNHVAGADEERHLDHGAGFEGGGFVEVGHRVAAHAGLGLADRELHEHGQLRGERTPFVGGQADDHA